MFKNKDLLRVVMIFVIGIILILMTPVLFKVVMELFSNKHDSALGRVVNQEVK